MVLNELVERSPIRTFMKSINGGLNPGELGLVASPSGIGKTSVLVQIALDKLLQGKKVIHVSFTQHTDYVLAWYEEIFDEFFRKKKLENEQDVKSDVVRNRVLMRFTQEGFSIDQILKSLRAMIKEGGFNADHIIVDGFDFSAKDGERITMVKAFAAEMGVSVWYSCTVKGEKPFYDERNIPLAIKDYADLFSVIIILDPKPAYIALTVSRDRDTFNPVSPSEARTGRGSPPVSPAEARTGRGSHPEHQALKLDPKTLLIR